MKLRSRLRECLYLNWALPVQCLSPAPQTLRYQTHTDEHEDYVFVSALLFNHQAVHSPSFPRLRASFPQLNLRVYVLDQDNEPSVLFLSMLAPAWVAFGVRLLGQPVRAARFRFDSAAQEVPWWRWSVRAGSELRVTATAGAQAVGPGPHFASWERTVEYIRLRNRGYILKGGKLKRIDTEQPRTEICPVQATVRTTLLLEKQLGLDGWPQLHSAWVCPEMPMVFDLAPTKGLVIGQGAPVPG